MKLGDRLVQLRKEKNYTRDEFAQLLGISKYTLRNYELGVTEPGHPFLIKIAGLFDTSMDYILGLTEEREKMHSYKLKTSEYEHIEKYRNLDDYGRQTIDMVMDRETGRVQSTQKQITALKKEIKTLSIQNRLLSYYGRIAAAGKSYGFEDMICGTIQVPISDKNQYADYAIGVSGNSMEPDFTGEDIVYVQKASHLNKDEIGIFQKDNCIYIKKVGDGVLLSTNPNYDPIPGNDVKVLGRVLGKIEGEYKIVK